MEITVLGKSPAWQDADGACSGYLIVAGQTNLLLECGSGVFAKLKATVDYASVDAILLSHLHADHMLDLVPFAYALVFSPRWQQTHQQAPRPVLYGPPGLRQKLEGIFTGWGPPRIVDTAFELHEFDFKQELSIGPLQVEFGAVPHYAETYAMRIVESGGGIFAYGADCGPNQTVVRLGKNADLMMLEATITVPELDQRGHLMPSEAGALAKQANPKRLVLTHISDELDQANVQREAEATFGRSLELAVAGATYHC